MNILMWWEDFDGKVPAPTILKPRPLWTGKQVFNLIIPKQINLIRMAAWHNEAETGFITPGDTLVRIEKGELLSGTLCKKTLGTAGGSLIHVIWLASQQHLYLFVPAYLQQNNANLFQYHAISFYCTIDPCIVFAR